MAKRSKAYLNAVGQYDPKAHYTLREAVDIAKKISFAKFDETINVDVALGVDPRKADQMIRGTVALPHGTGKEVRVVAIVNAQREEEAKAAGAEYVGAEDICEKIKGGWLDFDIVITTPDMMRFVGALGKILGPRGMMPNPKVGTVTTQVAEAIKEVKAGRLEYKVDKYGLIHLPAGKRSFKESQLFENVAMIVNTLVKVKPAASKGTYIKSITISPVMGPGIKVDTAVVRTEIDAVRSLG